MIALIFMLITPAYADEEFARPKYDRAPSIEMPKKYYNYDANTGNITETTVYEGKVRTFSTDGRGNTKICESGTAAMYCN